jgi:hypothetical protein
VNWGQVAIGVMALALGGVVYSEYQRVAQPSVRDTVANPIYTIGNRDFSVGLAAGRRMVKYGPMFLGLYPGGFAFRAPDDARQYLDDRKLDRDRWRIYELAGDFDADTRARGRHQHITRTLLVVREVRAES